ncbi:YciI family protein [Chelativorans sp. M5D2P16]|uniref:YciI family protein n=1 Tax=Chelativorans sp. M5D2P16 TaxID=3095678 RepID=UPI002ACAF14D|nr:YciI family protein [Chelativorans sp. M5D2P16]MDZ5698098.1 YciI family protein [Chelativorans sp. M5D2P16]
MRYAFLIHTDQSAMKSWQEEDMWECLHKADEYEAALKRSGHFILSHGLEWSSQATVLRKQSGKVVNTDGPFAETKEQLLGFLLIEARDREEAIALAAGLPMLDDSTVEVRAVEEFENEVPENVGEPAARPSSGGQTG